MKHMILLAPFAVCASGALAQTTSEASATGTAYGTAWSETIAQAFFSEIETKTLRPEAEIAAAWVGLTQVERDLVLNDCVQFRTDIAKAEATGSDTTADAPAEDTAEPDTDTDSADIGTTGEATDGAASEEINPSTMTPGLTAEQMDGLCALFEGA